MLSTDILEDYQSQISDLKVQNKALKKLINKYSFARLGLFLLAIILIKLFFNVGLTAVAFIATFLLLGFLILVKIQQKKVDLLRFQETKLRLLENEVNVLAGGENIYDDGSDFIDAQHPYTDDLDIFGAQSLYHYLNRCVSSQATEILASWLKTPAELATIQERQAAVQELKNVQKDGLEFRTRLFLLEPKLLTTLGHFISKDLGVLLKFLNHKGLKNIVRVLPFINLSVLAIAIFLGSFWWSVLGLILLGNGLFYSFFKQKIDVVHLQVEKAANALDAYARNVKWIEDKYWKNSLMNDLLEGIKPEIPLSEKISSLRKIVVRLNYRLNMLVSSFLNLFFQWDLHTLFILKDWHQQHQHSMVSGFGVMAQVEALLSLANLDYNHPEWVYPQLEQDFSFSTRALGHPLIPQKQRVNNHFHLVVQPTTDVITGSNMAGKSTFLRTVGVNMVLAFAGAKVCASSFKTSIFKLVSYMRIKDSLQNQTSTFKAEIDRLKMILDYTKQEKQAFVLIDEMLRGTNSKDKYLGTKVFIKKLIAQKTPGFIATHDLQIADLVEEYPEQLRNFHFDIQIQENEMYFDYQIKAGKCESFNASLLLKAIGLDIDSEYKLK
ncbi:MutS-related protein [Pedobacter puniceum]|uniref:DNA mismatch repair protein MutS n=1 Tax=Pedobacter puniceum TaxID=2666136 RepID=A0A7K0FI97_9SPHI|nr:DNA mismatch repair protein MutS [Pedobacter puniceum]MRX45709.1 DNA mismatch repair protein MutS [Pedobacter puniceum]